MATDGREDRSWRYRQRTCTSSRPIRCFHRTCAASRRTLHISQIANRHIGSPSEVLEEGQEIEAKVLEVRLDEHKISLSTRVLEEEESSADDYSDYTNQSEGFSVADLTEDDSDKKE